MHKLGLLLISAFLLLGGGATPALAQTPAPAQTPAAPPPATCASPDFKSLQPLMQQHSPTAAAPVSMILPADGSARLNFKQQIGTDADPRTYRVFEPGGDTANELRVFSVDPASAAPDGLFKPTDSVSLMVDIPPGSPWLIRTFMVVACKGPALAAWGRVTVPVSNPGVVIAICVIAGVFCYLLGMTAVYIQNKNPNSLEVKYPAVFGARRLFLKDYWNPIHLMADQFHRGSVQKAQVLLFSFLVGELVLSMALRTGALVNLSATIVALLGISGIGAAAAQIAYQQRTRLSFENWAWLEQRHVLKTISPADGGGPYWRDLVMSGREFDVYKLQTIIFTVAVAAALVVGGASHLANFTVPEALLGILGLSQVVYVGGVMVKPPAVGDLDDAITKLRQAKATLDSAKARSTDTDASGKLLDALPTGATVAQNAQQQYNDLADTVVTMIESALEVEADRSKL